MQRDIPHAKTLLAHPIVERLSLSRYWARLEPRSAQSLSRGVVSCIKVDLDVRYHAGSPEARTAHKPARGKKSSEMSQGVHSARETPKL